MKTSSPNNVFRFAQRAFLLGWIAAFGLLPTPAAALVIGGPHFDEATCSPELPELIEHNELLTRARKELHVQNANHGFYFEYFFCRLERQCLNGKPNTYIVIKKPDIASDAKNASPTLSQKALEKGTLHELVLWVDDKSECLKIKDDAQNRKIMQKLMGYLETTQPESANPNGQTSSTSLPEPQHKPGAAVTDQVKNLNGLKLF